jgi:hypothetical protein
MAKLAPSVVTHPLFRLLVPYFKIELYDRDGGHSHPRHRIELRDRELSDELLRRALQAEVACVRCGAPVHPFRARKKGRNGERPGHVYVAVACTLDCNKACSRGQEARAAYIEIAQHVRRETEVQREVRQVVLAEACLEIEHVRQMYAPSSDGYQLCSYILEQVRALRQRGGSPP